LQLTARRGARGGPGRPLLVRGERPRRPGGARVLRAPQAEPPSVRRRQKPA
jgi:hypothetical protein